MKGFPVATLGSLARAGHPITVWCNFPGCGYLLRSGRQHRSVLSPADLASFAEALGETLPFGEFRTRLRCRHCGRGEIGTIVESPHETPKDRWEREAAAGSGPGTKKAAPGAGGPAPEGGD